MTHANPRAADSEVGPPDASREPPPEFAGALLALARDVKNRGLGPAGFEYNPQVRFGIEELEDAATVLGRIDVRASLRHRDTALAFWINVYNALVIHAALRFGVRRRVSEARGFFGRASYRIGERDYSLNVIEHGILRANRGHPMRGFLPQLAPWDARRALVIRPIDIRIHFALNCGAVSCPPIRHYTAANIDVELSSAARSFVAGGGVSIDERGGGVVLSRIFLWYWRDFGLGKAAHLHVAARFLDDQQRERVAAAAARGIRYARYDWSFA